jgi:hypothetical protein
MAHTRIFCPSCKASFRVPAGLRNRPGRCPRCRAAFALHSPGGKAAAPSRTAGTSAESRQAPTPRVAPVGDTALDVPASGPTRWDLHALT